jgi:hypothetical protein
MTLDFTELNNITNSATTSPTEDFKPVSNTNAQGDSKKPSSGLYEALIDIGMIKEDTERPLDKAAEQTSKVLTLKQELNDGIDAAQDMGLLLLKAIECISLMTGDKAFYSSNKEKIEQINMFLG